MPTVKTPKKNRRPATRGSGRKPAAVPAGPELEIVAMRGVGPDNVYYGYTQTERGVNYQVRGFGGAVQFQSRVLEHAVLSTGLTPEQAEQIALHLTEAAAHARTFRTEDFRR